MQQGRILAPSLFCQAIHWILKLSSPHAGIHIGQEMFISQDYADAAAFLVEKLDNFSSSLQAFQDATHTRGVVCPMRKD